MGLRIRETKQIGLRGGLRAYTQTAEDPDARCPGPLGYHNALGPLHDVLDAGLVGIVTKEMQARHFGTVESALRDGRPFPMKCDACDHVFDYAGKIERQVWTERLYDTPSGKPEPGSAYWSDWMHNDDGSCPIWDNCGGPRGHLFVILPNGDHWNAYGRAQNCTLKDDRLHRCWVLSGSLEGGDLTASKNGLTCSAGAGSIASEGWHGFLVKGELRAEGP